MNQTNNTLTRFPTKSEACQALEEIIQSGRYDGVLLQILDGTRIALSEEKYDLNLWGKSFEETNILFDDLRVPYSSDHTAVIKNYQNWLKNRIRTEKRNRKE